MVSKTTPVNTESNDLASFGGRLVAERNRLRLKQVDVCALGAVSKTTQIKYESNERQPDTAYLERLDRHGFDVLYLLTGSRSVGAMTSEHQNLIEAYEDAPEAIKRAVFAVLIAECSNAVRGRVQSARKIPGYYRHELRGERDLRFNEWHETRGESDLKNEAGPNVGGSVGQVVQGDATFNGNVDIAGSKPDDKKNKK